MSNGAFKTIRIRFSKTDRAKYISHLDINRTMTRVLRRAHIPIWYTEGFNRHPYITFASPLSLGVESEAERMDFRLVEPMEMDELCRRLNEVMPQGLRAMSAAEAVCKAGDLGYARYRIVTALPKTALEAFLAQPAITARKKNKKGVWKELDIKNAMQDIELTEEQEGTVFTVTLPCNSNDTVNPALLCEVLREFVGEAGATFSVRRTELYTVDKAVFL